MAFDGGEPGLFYYLIPNSFGVLVTCWHMQSAFLRSPRLQSLTAPLDPVGLISLEGLVTISSCNDSLTNKFSRGFLVVCETGMISDLR